MYVLFVWWGDGQITQTVFGTLELAQAGDAALGGHGKAIDSLIVRVAEASSLRRWTRSRSREAAVGAKADLLKAALDVVEKRGLVYGQAENNFARIAELWTTYLDSRVRKPDPTIDETDVAAMMILMKVARLMEKPDHYDSWLDIAGYAACGAEVSGAGLPQEAAPVEPAVPRFVTNTPRPGDTPEQAAARDAELRHKASMQVPRFPTKWPPRPEEDGA